VVSAGCILWLSRFQPLFAAIAVCSLAYQVWLVGRRPRHRRTRMMLVVLSTSVATTLIVAIVLVAVWVRYQ
jgi:hypothetical protein